MKRVFIILFTALMLVSHLTAKNYSVISNNKVSVSIKIIDEIRPHNNFYLLSQMPVKANEKEINRSVEYYQVAEEKIDESVAITVLSNVVSFAGFVSSWVFIDEDVLKTYKRVTGEDLKDLY